MAPFFFSKTGVGIDIGTSAIKIVELAGTEKKIRLENLGQIPTRALFRGVFRKLEKNSLFLSVDEITSALKALLEEMDLKLTKVFFSIPDFATFFTTLELPPMSKTELPSVVRTEAKKYIPVSISEVALDWQVIMSDSATRKTKVLLVAVPQDVVQKYRMIASNLNLKSFGLEAEVFSLARVFGEEGKILAIFDLGYQTTSCSIIEGKTVRYARTIDIGSEAMTVKISKELGIGPEEAEELKKEFGIEEKAKPIKELLVPFIEEVCEEGRNFFSSFEQKEKKNIQKIVLTGGAGDLPGLLQYFKNFFKKEVVIGDPFARIIFPLPINDYLKEMGPSFSIGVGLALRVFEKK